MTTIFDFEAPGADQSGIYEAGPGAEVAAGFGRIAARAGWAERGQPVRVQMDVDSTGIATTRGVVVVPVSELPGAFRGRAALDGRDVTAYLTDASGLDRPMASGISTPSARGTYFVRVPNLPAGRSSFVLYAGDRAGAMAVDELAFFTDPSPIVRYFIAGGFTATTLGVVSMIDANEVISGGTSATLADLESRTPAAAGLGTEIVAAGPIAAAWLGAGGDSLPPESFAGTSFITPTPRYDEAIYVAAPFGDATLSFDAPAIAPTTITAGTIGRVATLSGDTGVIAFDSDVPVVVVRGSDSGDITPIPPAATELLGAVSGSALVAAGPMGATVTVTQSDGAVSTVTVGPNTFGVIGSGAAQGSGPTLRLESDQPIGGMTYGDADGGEAIAFLPPDLLGSELTLPLGAQFIIIATALPNTTCRLVAADGTELASGTSGPTAPPTPGRLFFGSTTNGLRLAAPAHLTCDGVVWAGMEDASSETEKLMIPATAHRPHPGGSITLTPGTTETRFDAGTGWVSTPALVPPRPMTGILSATATSSVEFGSALRFQISIDGGASWSIPLGGGLVPAADTEGVMVADLAGVTFPPTSTLALRSILETDGYADASVDDVTFEVRLVPPPVALEFEVIASPQSTGVELTTEVSARDATGAVVPLGGDVMITSDPAGILAPQTVTLVDGRAPVIATPTAGSPMVFLLAALGDVTGVSNPFEVIASSAGTTLEITSGDGQTAAPGATLATPIEVRVTDADGAPIAGLDIAFAPTAGSVDTTPVATDADGRASARWTLGDALGEQTLGISLVDDPSVSVIAMATASEGGGCGCTVARSRYRGTHLALLGLLGLALTWRLRRRGSISG